MSHLVHLAEFITKIVGSKLEQFVRVFIDYQEDNSRDKTMRHTDVKVKANKSCL